MKNERWHQDGDIPPRPTHRADGIPTRIDQCWWTPAEWAISNAMQVVEEAGASPSLTQAVMHLQRARESVANHFESIPQEPAE